MRLTDAPSASEIGGYAFEERDAQAMDPIRHSMYAHFCWIPAFAGMTNYE